MEGPGQERAPPSEGLKRKIADDFELARQKALEVAARLNTAAESKRPRFDSPAAASNGASSNSTISQAYPVSTQAAYNGLQGASKRIQIPNGKVGVIIGRSGDMIKSLQQRSGARIQITRDVDADPTSLLRDVDLTGTQEQVSRAEELINEVIAETEAAAPGGPGNRSVNQAQPGAEQFVMKVPNDKVALIIGKGGETIKSMQSKSGARIQVVPLRLPPGDTSTERSVYISGTQEQIDSAKELVNDVMSGNRLKSYSGSVGYTQATYPPAAGWASQGQPPAYQQQQPGYGYGQQAGYATQPTYYGNYPPQPPSWDQTNPSAATPQPPSWNQTNPSAATPQPPSWNQTNPSAATPQPQPSAGYNMYGQQQVQPPAAPPASAGYDYAQAPPPAAYNYNQGYAQRPPPTGSEQPKPYANPTPVYGQPPAPSSQAEAAAGAQPPTQPGYGVPAGSTAPPDAGTSQPQPSPAYAAGYPQPGTNGYGAYLGYGAPPSYNQAGYGQVGYGQQQQAAQAQAPAQATYYGQTGYPPVQANYYQGAYPAAPGQPPVQVQAAGGAPQPLSYGLEKAEGGNPVAGDAATTQETES